ncbi:hypothetical protein LCGC14_1461390 [marine sediment metagenome]|uniref:Uncharacterized protein n=1 Tax=marine sediment metagenome TaxID=412755 RepID=A0A0F9JFK2_9ZZZZ
MNHLKQALEDILVKKGRMTKRNDQPPFLSHFEVSIDQANCKGYADALVECWEIAKAGIAADTGQAAQAKIDAGILISFVIQMCLSDDLIDWLENQLDGDDDDDEDGDYQRMIDKFQAMQSTRMGRDADDLAEQLHKLQEEKGKDDSTG